MNQPIGIDCLFEKDGTVRVRRVRIGDQWLQLEQGRQWQDENGRHVLIQVAGGAVQEILLSPYSLQWELVRRHSGPQIV